jgi:hypothetical protein
LVLLEVVVGMSHVMPVDGKEDHLECVRLVVVVGVGVPHDIHCSLE